MIFMRMMALFVFGLMLALPVKAQEEHRLHGISAFGGLKYPADFAHFAYVNPQAPKGGRISMRPTIATRTFDNFNMFILKGDAADGTMLLYDTLMARAFDEPDALYGLLAHSVRMPADRSYAVFELREEARFSDGSALTAQDVVWSIETLRDKGDPRIRLPLSNVEKAEAIDAHTVRFDFAADAPKRDVAAVVAQMPIFSKAYYQTRDFQEAALEPPLFSGPYAVGKVSPGRTVSYVRRLDYWGAKLPVNRGRYNFDEIIYEYFSDHDVALEAFKAGEVDFFESFSSKNWSTKFDFAAVENGWVVKENLVDGRPAGTQGYFFNTRKEKLSDPQVRKALSLVFDFGWMNEKLFYGIYARTESFFENSDLAAEGPPTSAQAALLKPYLSELPADILTAPAWTPPQTDGSGRIRKLMREARGILREAGWNVVDGVLRNAQGEALEIEFLDRNGGLQRVAEPYIANLSKLGVVATYREVDAAQYERRVKAFDFDVVSARLPLPPTPGPELRGYLSSKSAAAEGSFNLAGVSSSAVDALLDAIEGAQSRQELQAAGRALDRVFRAGFYWTPHWNKAKHSVAYWDRFGRPADIGLQKPPFARAVRDTWWFDAAKSKSLDDAMGR